MNIAVYEHKSYTTCYRVDSASIDFNNNGVNAALKSKKFTFIAKDYGIDNFPINMDTLATEEQRRILEKQKDHNGFWISSRAHAQAQKIGM